MTQHRVWIALELLLVSAAFLLSFWGLYPRIDRWPFLLAFLLLAVSLFFFVGVIVPSRLEQEPVQRGYGPARTWFIKTDGLAGSLRDYLVVTLVGLFLLGVLALWIRPIPWSTFSWKAFALKFAAYIPSALLQGYLCFEYLLRRLGRILDSRQSAAAMALLFAIFHLPNLRLMLIVIAAGWGWAWLYQRRPNLLCLALSHAILGTFLHQVVAINMRTGPFFYSHRYMAREVIPVWGKIANQHLR